MEITADPTMLPLEELTRDEDFWLKDGTVVLVAKKTAFKKTAFRVYGGLLAAHSPVFDDMFSSATHADEMYDGCPVVRIPDSPKDFKWILTHLIPRTLLQGHVPEYPELSALARLGHKYQIDALEKHATDRLKAVFTNNVEQFERQLASPTYAKYNPIDIIHIGRLTNNPSMLPLAFWLCAQNEDIIIDGQARKDGAQLVLDKTDAKRCIVGICELCRMSERTIQQTLLAVPHPFCGSPTACRVAWDSWAVGLKTTSTGPQGSRGIHLLKGMRYPGCDVCKQAVVSLRRTQRRQLWKQLPKIFGLQAELKGHWPE